MKICTQCKNLLTIDSFHKHKRLKDGHSNICKTCAKNKTKAWTLNNKERKKEYDRVYGQENKKELSAKSLERKRKNKDHVNLLQRQRLAKNPDHHRIKNRQTMRNWRKKNKEREALRRAKLEASRPGVKAQKLREWRNANPEKAKALQAHRRALRRGALLSNLTAGQWRLIKKTQRFRCAYCGKKKPLTQDHITPLAKGGSHTMANIVAVCQSCNSKKFTNPAPIPVQPLLPLVV